MNLRARNLKEIPRFATPEARAFLAFTLAMDPTMKEQLDIFIRKLKVRNIRPDYMLRRDPVTGKVDELSDPGAWNAVVVLGSGACMSCSLIRFPDGKWSIHG